VLVQDQFQPRRYGVYVYMVQDHFVSHPVRHDHGDQQNHLQNNRQSIIKVRSEHHEKGFKPQSNSDIRLRAEQKVQNLQSCLRFW